MRENNEIKIDKIFPIVDQNYVIVHLESTEWSKLGKRKAILSVGSNQYSLIYTGLSNINGAIALKLIPTDKDVDLINKIKKDAMNTTKLSIIITDEPA